MRRRRLLVGATAALAMPSILRAAEPTADQASEVDVLLLLAVDVSRSMDEDEASLQRAGYREALRSTQVLDAIQGGLIGAIGLAYFEWSGMEDQRLLVPWTRIANAEDATAFTDRLAASPLGIGTWTSISGALDRASRLIQAAPFRTSRLIIDVSGDGTNNSGPPVEEARDRAVARGIVINGLPVMKTASMGSYDGPADLPLDAYYRQSVAGGFGSFVLGVEDFAGFGRAVRRKLVMEIAGESAPSLSVV